MSSLPPTRAQAEVPVAAGATGSPSPPIAPPASVGPIDEGQPRAVDVQILLDAAEAVVQTNPGDGAAPAASDEAPPATGEEGGGAPSHSTDQLDPALASRNVRQKTSVVAAEQAFQEAIASGADLDESKRIGRHLEQRFKQFTEEDERIRQGQCPECSIQNHDAVPLTNEHVASGLRGNPPAPVAVATAAAATEAGSSSSRAGSPLAVPEETRQARSARFCDSGVWGDYIGDLNANGDRHGKGKITYKNGAVYDGEWKNNKRDGQGSCRYKNGRTYDGGWKNDKMEGQGVECSPDDTEGYEGGFKNGKGKGHGTEWLTNPNREYVGGWRKGKKDGRGVLDLFGGESFTGEWKRGEIEGKGMVRFRDGVVQISNFHRKLFRQFGKGVQWSADHQTAWLLKKGEVTREVELSEAKALATRMGFPNVP